MASEDYFFDDEDLFADDEELFDVEELNEGFGLPLETYQLEQSPNFDPKYAWKEIQNPHQTRATIGVAVEEGWQHAKEEMCFIRGKLQERFGTSRPTQQQLFELVLWEVKAQSIKPSKPSQFLKVLMITLNFC